MTTWRFAQVLCHRRARWATFRHDWDRAVEDDRETPGSYIFDPCSRTQLTNTADLRTRHLSPGYGASIEMTTLPLACIVSR